MNLLSARRTALYALAISVVAGCGGGQSGPSNATSDSHTGTVGEATYSFTGNPKPLLTESTGNVTTTALAGASFSVVRFNPASILANTYLVYSRQKGTDAEIYKANYGLWQETQVTQGVNGANAPTASRFGQLYFEYQFATQIGECLNDGTNFRTDGTSLSADDISYPVVAPTGLTVAFEGNANPSGLFTCGINGGTATGVQTDDGIAGSSWFPGSTSLAYVATNGNIYKTAATGGTPTNITPSSYRTGGSWSHPAVSPDGNWVAGEWTTTNSSTSQVLVFNIAWQTLTNLTPSGDSDSFPTVSPDGNWIAFYRSKAGGAAPGIYVSNSSGTQQTLVVPDTTTATGVSGLNWAPYPASLALIGSNQFFNTVASGFLYTQVLSVFSSLVAFSATTPSSATITGAPSTGAQPLIFTMSADAITRIGYINSYFNNGTFITPPASTPSAVVSVDAVTGAVDTVATAAIPAKQLATRGVGTNVTYSGKFTGVYDSKGHNLAPSGASQVVLNAKTGHLVSFQ